MKNLITILTLLTMSSCNVMKVLGGSTEVPEDFFSDSPSKYRVGPKCSNEKLQTSVPFHAGTGGTIDPYVICSIQQLQSMKDHLSSHFILDADINAGEVSNFEPIGHCGGQTFCTSGSISPFTGDFDGKGYNIHNLNMSNSNNHTTGFGLFGLVQGNKYIQNFNIINAQINIAFGGTLFQDIGLIAGHISTGSPQFKDITIDGRINLNGGAKHVGLIAGKQSSGTISNINISANSFINIESTVSEYLQGIGSVVGFQQGNILKATTLSRLNITGTNASQISYIGGITGSANTYVTNRYISDSIFKGEINIVTNGGSAQYIGGILGRGGNIIQNSYTSPTIYTNTAATNSTVGGIAGHTYGGSILNTFSDYNATGSYHGLVGYYSGTVLKNNYTNNVNCTFTGLGSNECIDNDSLTGLMGNNTHVLYTGSAPFWNFSGTWEVVSNDFPRLRY